MADLDGEKPCTVREVAAETGISEPTVAKILQILAKDGILRSRKGPGGGFRLGFPAGEITLYQIVSAVEGKELFDECLGGLPVCSESDPCPLHEKWKSAKQGLVLFLDATTLFDLVAVMRKREEGNTASSTLFPTFQ
jgi:Rrf2 family protein